MDASSRMQNAIQSRRIEPSWNIGLIVASIAISLLGAFTTTQLMCQAKVSRAMTAVVTWTILASLTFGFCSIWSLHMVATLACELDLEIGLNAPMTALSAVLAVTFTFLAISDTIWERNRQSRFSKNRQYRREGSISSRRKSSLARERDRDRDSTELLLGSRTSDDIDAVHSSSRNSSSRSSRIVYIDTRVRETVVDHRNSPLSPFTDAVESRLEPMTPLNIPSPLPQNSERVTRASLESDKGDAESVSRWSSSVSRRDSDTLDSYTINGMGTFNSVRTFSHSHFSSGNIFKVTAIVMWSGLTTRNILKGLVWSFAVTCMHYLGIYAIDIPGGSVKLNLGLVTVSALISWVVCCVACILMPSMETNLSQQLLFACVAAAGVAAMHYSGMAATSFYTTMPPSDQHGYPPGLSVAIISIAIITCLAANGLLAHSATLARNKLAEIVRTRRKLWAAIAQKENAEAAALARSEFIASASHEIRTPLHQLQGYSDLMARCPLPEDARLLLFAIQDATKTLSLITNNVLDWSRLEKGEAVTRPSNLDIRSVCESVVKLLPRRDDDVDVELMAVVAPDVPSKVFLDETYLQRIIMNLVSNALKFTTSGYVSFVLEHKDEELVITVRDSGIGIPESFLPQLFEPFKQAQTRGAERGTGLGLSIVKQLLEKLQGNIDVDSKHKDARGIGPEKCGSKFIVSIPFQTTEEIPAKPDSQVQKHRREQLAYFGPAHSRVLEGLSKAWAQYDVEVIAHAENLAEVSSIFKYVWADSRILQRNTELLQLLRNRVDVCVLVPYEGPEILDELFGSIRPSHFITFQRPWVFHQIMRAVAAGGNERSKFDSANRSVRFAPEINVLDNDNQDDMTDAPSTSSSAAVSPDLTLATEFIQSRPISVFLVEDNKINRRLGSKMLKTLGYDVVCASDGQEAIDMLLDQTTAATIDVILMDQSMPRKDGLTATKEIREYEANGTIVGATRWQDHPQRRNRRPILAVTAVVGPGHETMCKTVGTDAFLPKPLSLSKLKEALDLYADAYSALDVQGL